MYKNERLSELIDEKAHLEVMRQMSFINLAEVYQPKQRTNVVLDYLHRYDTKIAELEASIEAESTELFD